MNIHPAVAILAVIGASSVVFGVWAFAAVIWARWTERRAERGWFL